MADKILFSKFKVSFLLCFLMYCQQCKQVREAMSVLGELPVPTRPCPVQKVTELLPAWFPLIRNNHRN